MPTYHITAPDGSEYEVTGNGSEQEALAQVQASHSPTPDLKAQNPSEYDPASPQFQAKYGSTSGMGTGEKMLAGAGKAFVDLGRGAQQVYAGIADTVAPRQQNLAGLVSGQAPLSRVDELRQKVAQSRQSDAPLMQSTAAKIGNIGSNVLTAIPALAIPGANTVAGAALVGAGMGFMQPSASTQETLTNTGVGAVAGTGGQWLGNRISTAVTNRLAARQTAAQTNQALNADRDAILARSHAEGYVVPPTAVNPSAAATVAESIAGKAATRQAAEAANARVSNRLVAQDLGLPANAPITRQALEGVRARAGQVYQQVRNTGTIATDAQFAQDIGAITQAGTDLEAAAPGIGAQAGARVAELATALQQPQFTSEQAVGLFRFLNNHAKTNFDSAFASGNPELLDLARAQRHAADAVGELIERHLASTGRQPMYQAWQNARRTIAQSYMAESALKGNNVDALRLAAQMRRGAPLSGGFRTVAEFGDQFGEVARVPKSGVGVSALAATVAGGGAALGHPGLLAIAAVPYATRRTLLSGAGQALLATPHYAPGMIGTAGLNALGTAGRFGTLPAYRAANSLIEPPQ